jgi:hypothetical protein
MIEFFYILCILCFIGLLLPLGDVLFVAAWEPSKLTILFVWLLLSVALHWLYGLLVFLFSIRITFVDASIEPSDKKTVLALRIPKWIAKRWGDRLIARDTAARSG